MEYLTGIHALNLPCSLETCGDWHTSALKWKNLTLRDSSKMFFREYGIETPRRIPEHTELYYTANHIRALLDILTEEDYPFPDAQGMNDDFICNPKYDKEVFDKIYMLRYNNNWDDINRFMKREYKLKWCEWLEKKECSI